MRKRLPLNGNLLHTFSRRDNGRPQIKTAEMTGSPKKEREKA